MPEIQLNGKTIATQTGTNEPVLKNNVVMESGFSIPSGVTIGNGVKFPAGHIIQSFVIQNDTRVAVAPSSEATLFGDNFTKLRSDTDIFATCTVYGSDFEAGNCGVGMKLNSTWQFGCGYQYDGAWVDGMQTTIIIGTGYWSTPPAGASSIYFGWKPADSDSTLPFAVFNPNETADSRNQQFISSIVVYEVMPR